MKMSSINHQENHARQLLGLIMATAILTSVFAVRSYSATRSRSSGVGKTNRATSPLTQPQTPALKANGKIAFVSDRDGNDEIYVMDADGGNPTQLTNNPAGDGDVEPNWSPDGTRIVFTSHRHGDDNTEIYVMNADGSNQTRLTNNTVHDFEPAWSPDGTKIVFVRRALDVNEIFVMNADGSGQTKITEGFFVTPVWSPDGTKIAFVCEDDLSEDICAMNADGSELRRLTQAQTFEFNYDPAWSPDGARILLVLSFFCIFEPCSDNLVVINADGSNRQQLLSGSTIANPGWSPDGTRITFDSAQSSNSNRDIFVADSSGTGVTNLSNHPARDADPAWGRVALSATSCPNPIDCAEIFIRQQYLDFLGREPEPEGLQFYMDILNGCQPSDTECIKYTRGALSANFFRSPEFQRKGSYVMYLYMVSIGQRPVTPSELSDSTKVDRPHYSEFFADLGSISTPNDDPTLTETKKAALADAWMQRAEIQALYPPVPTMTNAQFVQKLLDTAGVTISNQNQMVQDLNNNVKTRAQVLRIIAESPEVNAKFYKQAFVTMEYFGYLRRDPEDCHNSQNWTGNDPNQCGFIFHNNRFNLAFDPAQVENVIVRGFIESPEYRNRFGP
jgi:hypothetical protein